MVINISAKLHLIALVSSCAVGTIDLSTYRKYIKMCNDVDRFRKIINRGMNE